MNEDNRMDIYDSHIKNSVLKKLSWSEILNLLGMDCATIIDDAEAEECYNFVLDYIENNGADWVKNNANFVINSWEANKDKYQKPIEERKNQTRKRSRKPIHGVDTYGTLGRLHGSKVI